MNDTPTLVQFKPGWERDGVSDDGMPYYKTCVIVRMDRPPLLSIERVAEPDDFTDYPQPFELYRKEQAARKQSYAEGYPICMWPAVNEAEFKMLADRDITTVSQLAGLRNVKGLPAELKELADRARVLIQLQSSGAKFETIVTELRGQIEALKEQVEDANKIISAQKTMIAQLQVRGAG